MTAPAPFRDERGSALPVVVGVLLTIGILATVLLNTSVELRHSTSQGRQAKQAFAAANAGLAVAKYRLNKLVPPTDKCLTDRPVSAGTGGAVAGQCPGRTEMLGDGASYTYYVSQALPSGTSQCTVPSGTDVTTKDWRCITSVGSVAGEKRRVQALVASLRSAGKFAVNGVLALSSMKQSGTANITGDVAGNGKMEFAGPPLPARVLLGPSGTVKPTSIPVTYQAADYTAQTYDAEFAASAASNDNASLSPLPTNVTLNAFRELAATNTVGTPSSPWVLPSGTYNFCDFSFGNKTYIQLAPGARVHIYIDSPAPGAAAGPARATSPRRTRST